MDQYLELDFLTLKDHLPVAAEVYFHIEDHSDDREYGERTIRESYRTVEVTHISFRANNKTYMPTPAEYKRWNNDINRAIDHALKVA